MSNSLIILFFCVFSPKPRIYLNLFLGLYVRAAIMHWGKTL